MMKQTEWLYGVPPEYFEGMEFYSALEARRELARQTLFDEVRNGPNRKDRVADIEKAMEWCDNLLKERRSDGAG